MEVTVYTTGTCPYCSMVKEFLTEKGVKFTERRVDEDPDAYGEFLRLKVGTTVPVTVVDGTAVVGFDRQRLQTLLGR